MTKIHYLERSTPTKCFGFGQIKYIPMLCTCHCKLATASKSIQGTSKQEKPYFVHFCTCTFGKNLVAMYKNGVGPPLSLLQKFWYQNELPMSFGSQDKILPKYGHHGRGHFLTFRQFLKFSMPAKYLCYDVF